MTSYGKVVSEQRAFFKAGGTRALEKRIEALHHLRKLVADHVDEFADAYAKDLGRGKVTANMEAQKADARIEHALKHIEEWAKTQELPTVAPLDYYDGDRLVLVKEPLGVVLNIAPWNGPVTSIASNMFPLAAGNTVIFKPSELAPACAELIAKLAPQYFDPKLFTVITGGIEETTALLKERFDHIFYTGSTVVGKIIMTAAAKYLTPITLELGGKNPVFIDETADIKNAVSRLLFAKSTSAAQICICPDYVLVETNVKDEFVVELKKQIAALPDLSTVETYGKIVHDRAYERLAALLANTKGSVIGRSAGETSAKTRFFPVTAVQVKEDDVLMEDEIFGPILVVCEAKDMNDALRIINDKEKPLAAYLFTNNHEACILLENVQKFVDETSSGGVTINDVFLHSATPEAPFGGVGNSGMGRILGKFGFDNFTHEKPVAVRQAEFLQ